MIEAISLLRDGGAVVRVRQSSSEMTLFLEPGQSLRVVDAPYCAGELQLELLDVDGRIRVLSPDVAAPPR